MGAACVPKNFNIEGVYAEADGQPTEWLGFTAGLRYDRNSVIDTRASPRAELRRSTRPTQSDSFCSIHSSVNSLETGSESPLGNNYNAFADVRLGIGLLQSSRD